MSPYCVVRNFLIFLIFLAAAVMPVFAAGGGGSSSSPVSSAGKVAVVFSDMKFDDKVAIWSLLGDARYTKVLVITSAIEDHGRAATALHGFLWRQQESGLGIRFDVGKLQIVQGHNNLLETAPHESWYRGLNPMLLNKMKEQGVLEAALRGHRVAIFQIAPTSLEDVAMVVKAADPASIESYMLLHGYNSRQGKLDTKQKSVADMVEQERFITNLQSTITRRNPEAQVIFTSSMQSYVARDGGKHRLDWVWERFPHPDVNQALLDPFWIRQLKRAGEMTGDDRFKNVDEDAITEEIKQARLHPRASSNVVFRNQLSLFISQAIQKMQQNGQTNERIYHRLVNTLQPEFLPGAVATLELADAGQIALFHQFTERKNGIKAVKFRYQRGVTDTNAAPKLIEVPDSDHTWDGWLLKGGNTELDRRYLSSLLHI